MLVGLVDRAEEPLHLVPVGRGDVVPGHPEVVGERGDGAGGDEPFLRREVGGPQQDPGHVRLARSRRPEDEDPDGPTLGVRGKSRTNELGIKVPDVSSIKIIGGDYCYLILFIVRDSTAEHRNALYFPCFFTTTHSPIFAASRSKIPLSMLNSSCLM